MKNKTNPLLALAIGAGLMTFGVIYNYHNGDYVWATLQAKILIGYGIVAYLVIKNGKRKVVR